MCRRVLHAIQKNKLLTIIVFGSFFISLLYSFAYRIHPIVDAKAYDSIAVNIAAGQGFREDRTKPILFDSAITRAGPAYEYVLAGIYSVFGHRYEAVWIFQALLHALSALLIYLICLRVFGNNKNNNVPPLDRGRRGGGVNGGMLDARSGQAGPQWHPSLTLPYEGREPFIGLIAAAMIGFSPDLVEISAMLMTETLYVFCTILVVYVFVRAYEKPTSISLAGLLGAATGVAILTRPPILLFVPIILFFFWTKKQWHSLLVCLVLTCSVLVPWTVRNYSVYHRFIPTTMIGDYNIWLGNTLSSNGGQFNSDSNPLNAYAAEHGYAMLGQKASAEFRSFVTEHPAVFLKLSFIRFIRYFSLIRPMGFWFYQTGIPQLVFVMLSGISIAVLFIFGFAGMLKYVRKRDSLFNYLIVMALTAPVLLFPTVVQSRYRFQIYPFLAIFAGAFLISLFQNWSESKKYLYATALFLGIVSVIDAGMSFGIISDRLQSFF